MKVTYLFYYFKLDCVYIKRITLCNYLCYFLLLLFLLCQLLLLLLYFSVSLVRNIRVSRIRDFGPCRNVKNIVCCYATSSSRQKTDSVILRNNSSVQPGLSLEKNPFVILHSAVRKLYKLSRLSLLIANYSFPYLSIYLFILSLYLPILLVVRVSYQRVACLDEG